MRRRYWTPAEEEALRKAYANSPMTDLRKQFDRPERSIYNKAMSLNLKRSAELIRKQALLRLTGPKSMAHRFRKGGEPWNKGKPFESGGRSIETRFKPGNRPHTWKPIGSGRLDREGYLMRKVSDTGVKRNDWMLAHVHLWEQTYGPMPDRHVLVFIDGDKRNITIGNLELVSRAELMRRNTVHRYPKEIAQLSQLVGALNRQINRRTER